MSLFRFFLFSGLSFFLASTCCAQDIEAVEEIAAPPEILEVRPQKIATLLEVPLPITWSSVQPIYRSLQNTSARLQEEGRKMKSDPNADPERPPVRPILILSFKVANDQEMHGRGSQFGACYGLARLLHSEEFQGIKIVSYFPQSVEGHAILVALAAEEWLVCENAEFGNAGVDEKQISPAMKQAYRDIGRRFPEQIVLKMLDSSVELFEVETVRGIDWTDREGVQNLRQEGDLIKDPDQPRIPAGAPGIFTAAEARQSLGIVDFLINEREGEIALANGLGIKAEQISFARIHEQTGRAVRIDLNGPITAAKASEIERQIRKATEENTSVLSVAAGQHSEEEPRADFVCLWIDSSGGSLFDSVNLASFLANDVDPMKVRLVAYVPYQARSDAAIIALACHELVLGPEAILGGSGERVFSEKDIQIAVDTISQSLSKKTFRRWSLPAAMIDPNLEVYKMSRKDNPGLIEYFCEAELRMQADAEDWIRDREVTKKGLFSVSGEEALPYYLADKVAKDFSEFKLFYHLENDPTLIAPGWADTLIRALGHPMLTAVLLMIGFFALFAEIKTPGIGLGAFVAIFCFTLFFWSRYLGGTAGWLEVSLFLMGVLFVLMEIFVIPGFGIFGIGGGAAILASLVLASQTFIIPRNPYQLGQFKNSMLILIVSIIGMGAIAYVLSKWLHEINKPKDLELIRESEKLADYSHLLGKEGIASTPLVPAGKAVFDGESIGVVSDCELVEAGTPVLVLEVRGYRVLVRKK